MTDCSRISKKTKDKLRLAMKTIKYDKMSEDFLSEDKIVDFLCDHYFEYKGIKIDQEITDRDIEIMERIIKKHNKDRLDNNFNPDLRNSLKELAKILHDSGKTMKRLDYKEIIFLLLDYYMENNPDMKKYFLEDKYIKRSLELEEVVRKVR